MGQNFTFDLTGNLSAKLSQIKAAAAAKSVHFSGDLSRGQFSGMGLSGTYSVSGSTIIISVETKPFFVSWEYIESQLRTFVEG